MQNVKIIECPRDAMQGIKDWIPTAEKAQFIQSLLSCGFDTIDFGSFVSPRAIPQMRDTAELISLLDFSKSNSKLLSIIANVRGAQDAVKFTEIDYLGYPFSISENFQMRNTHKTIAQSIDLLNEVLNIADSKSKTVVAYLSMGFGNPYGDPWNLEIVGEWTEKLASMGVKIISLSDTIGSSNPETITYLFTELIPKYPHIEFGAHLHTQPHNWYGRIDAAYKSGCRRFDSAIKGFGGCPMAKDDLTGNMATENLISYFDKKELSLGIDKEAFTESMRIALEIFP